MILFLRQGHQIPSLQEIEFPAGNFSPLMFGLLDRRVTAETFWTGKQCDVHVQWQVSALLEDA